MVATNSRRVVVIIAFVLNGAAHAQLVQIKENFSQDPGWDHYQNRIIGTDMPKVIQDFGWRPTRYTGNGPGEIGGRVENSRRQAYYALPLGRPFSFDDKLSASGKIAVKVINHLGDEVMKVFRT